MSNVSDINRYGLSSMESRLHRGETFFALRAQDVFMVPTIEQYMLFLVREGVGSSRIMESLSSLRERTLQWQTVNKHLVKTPDIPDNVYVRPTLKPVYIPRTSTQSAEEYTQINVRLEEIRVVNMNIPDHYLEANFTDEHVNLNSPNVHFRINREEAVSFAKRILDEYADDLI